MIRMWNLTLRHNVTCASSAVGHATWTRGGGMYATCTGGYAIDLCKK